VGLIVAKALADLTSYCLAQECLGAVYSDPGAWATQSNTERREFRNLFERPHHCGVRIRQWEGGTMPGTLETSLVTGEVNACRGFQSRRSRHLFEAGPAFSVKT
jgi:hypothetical protein